MDMTSTYIIYLILFRLAIIAAGIMSIALGYRLFCKGIFPDKASDIDAQFAGWKFAVKNAGPGTSFAMFGVLIIAVMFATSPPQLTQETVQEAGGKTTRKTGLRGGDDETPKDIARKIARYEEALATTTNSLAWLYYKRGENDGALPLARLAVELSPNDANALDTLADILFKTEEYDEAVSVMEKAVSLAPDDQYYTEKLQRFREANK